MSHTLSVRSSRPLTRRLPSGLNATLVAVFACPCGVTSSCLVDASHTFTSPGPQAPSAHRLLGRFQRPSVERAAAARLTAACGAALEPLADLGGRGTLW